MDTIVSESTVGPADTTPATFTKWLIGEGPDMAGTVGGAVGDGTYRGKVLEMNPARRPPSKPDTASTVRTTSSPRSSTSSRPVQVP